MANDQQTVDANNNKPNENVMEITSEERSNDEVEMNDGEGMEQQQNGNVPTDFLGLNALRSAISAIGDAMAELAETSAQRLQQYMGGDGTKVEENEGGGGGERVEENVSLTAASEVGMATNCEQSNGHQWVHQQQQIMGEEQAQQYSVAALSVNVPI